MRPKILEWDGKQVPKELKQLPPGRYAIESIDEMPPLSDEEERGILEALGELDSGGGIPLADVIREIRGDATKR